MNKDAKIYDEMTGEIMETETTDWEFMQSVDIAELSKALCLAQAAMTGAVKDSTNPFFKSKYSDLKAVWDDIRKPFADNQLSVIQMPAGGVGSVKVITQITHNSGQWVRSRLTMVPVKNDPQGIGSCITYARRYALAAMAGVYQIDDDGNKGSATGEQISTDPVDLKKVEEMSDKAIALVNEDSEDYIKQEATEILRSLSNDERTAMQGILKACKLEGSRKTYYGALKDRLELERKARKAHLAEVKGEMERGVSIL